MAVLHIVQFSLPEVHSGYTLRTQAIVRAQKALGLDPLVLTSPRHPGQAEHDQEGVLHYRCTPERPSRTVWARDARRVRALRDRIVQIAGERGDVRVLHAHSPVLCGMAALRAARGLGLPVVYEVRGLWEEAIAGSGPLGRFGPRYLLARALESRVCRRAEAVVTISKGLEREFAARGVPNDRIHLVPNGVDIETFAPRSPAPGWRASLGLSEGPLILYLGAIRRYEGLEVLLDAFGVLRKHSPTSQLLLVGEGEDRGRVAARAAALGPGVRLLPPVPHSSVPEYYAGADIIAYPRLSTRATELVTPLKPLEAMAMGKAIAASDVGGLREILTDGETARLFRAGSVDGLADALLDLLSDEGERRRLGEAARRLAQERFDWPTVAGRYVEVYRAVGGP